jgi:hypothetical protein
VGLAGSPGDAALPFRDCPRNRWRLTRDVPPKALAVAPERHVRHQALAWVGAEVAACELAGYGIGMPRADLAALVALLASAAGGIGDDHLPWYMYVNSEPTQPPGRYVAVPVMRSSLLTVHR